MAAPGVPIPIRAVTSSGQVVETVKVFGWLPASDGTKTSTPVVLYLDPACATPAQQGETLMASRRILYKRPQDSAVVEIKSSNEATIYGQEYYPTEIVSAGLGDDVASVLSNGATDPDGIFGAFVPMAFFGAVGDGVTLDDDAVQAAAASGLNVVGDPGSSYLISEGMMMDAGTVFIGCHFKLKVGTGGFATKTDVSATRYDLDKVAFRFRDCENGGGFDNCTWEISGSTEVAVMAFAIQRGTETKPIVFLGLNRFIGFTGFNSIWTMNEAGAAGVHCDTLQIESMTSTRSVAEGYWTSAGGFAQFSGGVIDGDVTSHHSKNLHIKRIVLRDLYVTGQAYVEGPQLDGITIGVNFSGVTQAGRSIRIDAIDAYNVDGEVIDAQGAGWWIGQIQAYDCLYAFKAPHGGQGRLDSLVTDLCAVSVLISGSSNIAQATAVSIGSMKVRNPCKYILQSGTAQAGSNNTITLASAASSINDYYYKSGVNVVIRITGGTGSGQSRVVSDYVGSTRVATVSSNWGVNPASDSTYEILWNDNRAPITFGTDDGTLIGAVSGNMFEEVDIEDGTYADYKIYSGVSGTNRANTVVISEPNGRTLTLTGPAQANTPSLTVVRKNQGQWRVLAASSVVVNHTGDTTETTKATVTIPANSMGPNGLIRITALWSWTESGNDKLVRIRFGGTIFSEVFGNTSILESLQQQLVIGNRNAANSQVGSRGSQLFSYSGDDVRTAAIDTTSATTVVFGVQLANSGETISLESYLIEILYAN